MSKFLQIGDFVLPQLASVASFSQVYEPIGGEHVFRAVTGRGIKQMTWQKLKVTTTGTGWIPAGLEQLDYAQHHVLRCITPQAIHVPADQLSGALPLKRRSDTGHEPWCHALMPGGKALSTQIKVSGDEATITPVPSARSYMIQYYPELTVIALRPRQGGDRGQAIHTWELVCEEL